MGLPIEFYVYVGYGLFAIVAVVVIMNFLLGGFLGPFMKVKRSRGKMVLVRVHHPVSDYFRAGTIEENFLIYKTRKNIAGETSTKRIPMIPGVVSRAIGVFWTEVDEEKNCFFKRATGEAVGTYDPVRVDSYIVRALVRPGLFGDQTVKILLLLVIVLLIGLAVVGYLTFKNGQSLKLVLAAVQTAGQGVIA